MDNTATKLFKPDAALIRQHLEFITKGMADYQDGRIEIAYGDAQNVPKLANTFEAAEIDQAAAFALEKNAQGRNVYIVGSYLNPDLPPFGRSSDTDFYASSVLWCDIDRHIEPQELRTAYAALPPSLVVVTGRQPHIRTHLWWKLQEPITDADTLREALEGVQTRLGGDRAVKNVTSLMRLGGTVAWPKKSGRVTEKTEIIIPSNATPETTAEAFLRAYPADGFTHAAFTESQTTQITAAVNPFEEKVVDGREQYMHEMLCAAIVNLTAEYGRWPTPQEVFEDAWPVYARKVAARGGKTLDQDGRGQKLMQSKIRSKLSAFTRGKVRGLESVEIICAQEARKKPVQATQETFDPITGEIVETAPEAAKLAATSLLDIDLENIPPREFLFGTMVGRKYVTMIVAPPGAGKSIFTMQMGLCAAAGKQWGEWKCRRPLKVWLYNNEEGFDELRRRIRGVLQHMEMSKQDIKGAFYMDSGENRSISIAKMQENDVISTPDYEALKQEIMQRGIDLLIVDPFAETHGVNENSNDEIKRVAALYRQIAFDCNCAVLLVHHTRKGMDGTGGSQAGNADMARGGGATIGVVRRAYTMSSMTKEDAEKLGVPAERRRWYVRIDDAKSNITPPADRTDWLEFKSVAIGNGSIMYPDGDYVGVLEPITPDEITENNAEEMASENEDMVQLVVQYMDANGLDKIRIRDLADSLITAKKTGLKPDSLRKKITDSVKKWPRNNGLPFNGMLHFVRVVTDATEKNAAFVTVKRSEI